MSLDLMNELQYMFGTKAARAGELTKDPSSNKIEPNLLQKYVLGLTSADLEAHDLEGRFNRFKDSDPLATEAKRYNVDISKSDLNNLGGLQDRIDEARDLKNAKAQLRSLKPGVDVSGYTTAESLQPLIKQAQTQETIREYGAIEAAKHNSPGAQREREVQDRRWNYTQRQAAEDRAERQKDRLLDRAESREARAQEMQLMLMRDRKEDRRYNEAIDRQDRKDRQASIQTLVAGLANLGAAFAL